MDTVRLNVNDLLIKSGFTKIKGEDGWIYTTSMFCVAVYTNTNGTYHVGLSGDCLVGDVSFEETVEESAVLDTARLLSTKYVACVREANKTCYIQVAALIQNMGACETKIV